MFSKLFGFRGRMGRLSYLGWAGLASVFATIWFLCIAAGLTAGLIKGSPGALFGSALIAMIGVVPIVWMFLALYAKRLRDAGFPPALVLPVVIGFTLFDALVLSRYRGGQPLLPFMQTSSIGFAVNMVFGLALLFWPSAPERDDGEAGSERRSGEVPWHERALALASSLPPEQAPTSYASPMPSAGQPRTFGRRGI